jgi:cytochrome c peroxidase
MPETESTLDAAPVTGPSDASPVEVQLRPLESASVDEGELAAESPSGTGERRVDMTVTAGQFHGNVPAFNPKFVRRLKRKQMVRQWLHVAARYQVTAAACVVSMILGCTGSLLAVRLTTVSTANEAAIELPPKYVAATHRRHEPIKPVIPFDGLDSDIIEIGRRLFHDPSLSGSGKYSCASCHQEIENAARPEKPSHVPVMSRDIPSVINAPLNFALGWDGQYEDLESFLDSHFSKNGAMESDWERVLKVVREDPLYNRSFQLFMHAEPSQKMVRAALATYQRSLLLVDSTFDQWLRGNESALSGDAIAGYYLFKQLGCISCHQGVGVGGTMLRPLGSLVETLSPTAAAKDLGLFAATGREKDKHVFRVPPLRNVALTAPYFHDGSVAQLEKAVELMMRHQLGIAEPNPIEIKRLTAFLHALTGKPLDEATRRLLNKASADGIY